MMETASLWVALGATLAAVASAVFAFVQAKAATDSRRDAQDARDESRVARDESARLAAEANEAFKRQAIAQEEANRLKLQEMTPPDWTGPVHVSGQLFRLTNTSREVLLVSDIEIHPENMANMFILNNYQEDGRYEYGDVIEFIPVKTIGGGPEKLVIPYTKEGSTEPHSLIVRL